MPAAVDPIVGRNELLADRSAVGRSFTDRYTDLIDAWLAALFDDVFGSSSGCSLVAVGGQGRRELSPGSDLDLILLNDGGLSNDHAQQLWYPLWDQGMKVGHSVRTHRETLRLAADDLPTATSLLSARHIAGDPVMSEDLAAAARAAWRKGTAGYLSSLSEAVRKRHDRSGEVAFDLEPEVKEGRGGLRDVHSLGWAALADGVVSAETVVGLEVDYETLLAARVELHRSTGRNGDTLLLQEQDVVAERLGYSDADALMASVASAARSIAWVSDETWFRLDRRRPSRRDRKSVAVGEHLSVRNGELFRDEGATVDHLTALTVAVAAAESDARLSRELHDDLSSAPAPDGVWDEEARGLFVRLLLAGRPAISVIETLDHLGTWCRLIPEWEHTRSRPQRNAYHRFTVDRHLLETVANAAELAGRVDRPDLLMMGALLHDIGKGYPGDHSHVGRTMAAEVCSRLGFSVEDNATIQLLVEHHLLLPDVATRRDIDDNATLRLVGDRVQSVETLELLAALTEADSIATGASAWGSWKAGLVSTLTDRVGNVLRGVAPDDVKGEDVTSESRALMAQFQPGDDPLIVGEADTLRLVCDDRPGTFAKAAAVMALNGLNVLSAFAYGENGIIVDEFRVSPTLAVEIDWAKVISDLRRALRGRLALESRLAERSQSYSGGTKIHELDPTVRALNEASDDATVIEIIAPDSVGLLYRLAKSLNELELNICSAKVSTLGSDVVDVFYVTESDGAKITDPDDLREICNELSHVLDPSEVS